MNLEATTAGILTIDAEVEINRCDFAFFRSGGIMIQQKPDTKVKITENKILSCDTSAIYVQGIKSKPLIEKNTIMFCRCNAITTNTQVDAEIRENSLRLNEVGIEIRNN